MSPEPARGDAARVTVRVEADPALAFQVFTAEIDQWWRRGVVFRPSGRSPGVLHLEPGPGGRLFETYPSPAGERLAEVGRVLAWEPPGRLVLEWRNQNFAPFEKTEVEVLFDAAGEGTLVSVTHRGWSRLRPDHPARHGLEGAAHARQLGLWWAKLLRALAAHVASRRGDTR